jgi:hypothetical protein
MMFHDMLAAESASFLTVDTHFTQKLSENPRHLSFGAQFTHYYTEDTTDLGSESNKPVELLETPCV